ncbi:hypothetical protein HDV57DRAFT_136891 [Trichoderma longibrachiatum]
MYQAPVTEQALPHSSESFRSVSVSSQQKKHQKRQVKKQKRKKKKREKQKAGPCGSAGFRRRHTRRGPRSSDGSLALAFALACPASHTKKEKHAANGRKQLHERVGRGARYEVSCLCLCGDEEQNGGGVRGAYVRNGVDFGQPQRQGTGIEDGDRERPGVEKAQRSERRDTRAVLTTTTRSMAHQGLRG